MSAGIVFAVGGALAVAATVYIFWPAKRKPLPPLPIRRYQPAHELPSKQLTDCEEIRFGVLWDSYYHLEAADPMEQSGDR